MTSPIPFAGVLGSIKDGTAYTRIVLDGTTEIYYGELLDNITKWLFIPTGQHTVTLSAYNSSNSQIGSVTISVTISSEQSPAVLSGLQSVSGWNWCTQDLLGSACASGLGQATSTQTMNQATPSLSGSSTLYTIGGAQGYSNALWWLSVGGGTLVSQLTYDLDFYIDDAAAPEALEFDVNQSFGGLRYTWGTECSYKNTHKWDVWNPKDLVWVTSSAPCPQVTSNQWHHLKWQFELANGEVHYISVSVDSNTYPVDLYLQPQANYDKEDLNIAFQMDGNSQQTPYRVWLDNVTLTISN